MNIYITNEANKMRLLDNLSKEKKFNNNKFYSFRELKKKLIFDYNNKTIEYVMNKYNVNINIAKIYLENLYFLKDLEDNKVKFLNALKKDLDENNLLIYNKEFRKYLENKDITVYNKSKLSKEEKRILEGLNIRIENNLNNNYEPSIYEAENIEEEVEYVVKQQNLDLSEKVTKAEIDKPVVHEQTTIFDFEKNEEDEINAVSPEKEVEIIVKDDEFPSKEETVNMNNIQIETVKDDTIKVNSSIFKNEEEFEIKLNEYSDKFRILKNKAE